MKKQIFFIIAIIIFTCGCNHLCRCPKQEEIEEQEVKLESYFDKSPVITPFSDKYWLLLEDLNFTLIKNENEKFVITVPAGFVCDLASIPDGLNVIYDKFGRYASAGIIHDYLYWMQPCKRKVADRIIKEALKASNSGYTARNIIKWGVKIGGKKAWKENKKMREDGIFRFIPDEYRKFSPDTKWIDYSETLISKCADKQMEDIKIQEYCNIFE